MDTRDAILILLEKNIESIENEIETLEMALSNKKEELEKYYELFDYFKHH